MATGTVKWFSDVKGYGFITPDEAGPDLFVHCTGIADSGGFKTLAEGAKVELGVREGRKGLEAFNVVPIGGPPHATPSREGGLAAAKKRFALPGRPRRAGSS
jgi:CspA family cold shock protein